MTGPTGNPSSTPLDPSAMLKEFLGKLNAAIQDLSELEVVMHVAQLSSTGGLPDESQFKIVAKTTVSFDQDRHYWVPVDNKNVPIPLYDLHKAQVEEAVKARNEMLKIISELLKSLIPTGSE